MTDLLTLATGLLPLAVVYLLFGLGVAIPLGGRDPLDFAPPRVVVGWPVIVAIATVRVVVLWFVHSEHATSHADD